MDSSASSLDGFLSVAAARGAAAPPWTEGEAEEGGLSSLDTNCFLGGPATTAAGSSSSPSSSSSFTLGSFFACSSFTGVSIFDNLLEPPSSPMRSMVTGALPVNLTKKAIFSVRAHARPERW